MLGTYIVLLLIIRYHPTYIQATGCARDACGMDTGWMGAQSIIIIIMLHLATEHFLLSLGGDQ